MSRDVAYRVSVPIVYPSLQISDVKPGQIWTWIEANGTRRSIRVDGVMKTPFDRYAWGREPGSERRVRVRWSTLAKGLAGAQLIGTGDVVVKYRGVRIAIGHDASGWTADVAELPKLRCTSVSRDAVLHLIKTRIRRHLKRELDSAACSGEE